ncbi:MAG: hypothetical protein HYT76_01235 [Deltaproteobacteria bacterium]|nr:hypothetical protein [Deltaproteobacteria bacterium]
MPSQCPKCRQVLDEDYICCADIQLQWKCVDCHKRSIGFAFPFGRCSLCGGNLTRVEPVKELSRNIQLLQEALQIEITSSLFYRRLSEAVDDPEISDFFETMSDWEKEHARELSQKYHLHLGEEMFQDDNLPLPFPFFDDLSFFAATGNLRRLYDCGISLEKKTLRFFEEKARQMPMSREKELYQELAAEERDHIALLESERDKRC